MGTEELGPAQTCRRSVALPLNGDSVTEKWHLEVWEQHFQ